jgi:hypothetical protein
MNARAESFSERTSNSNISRPQHSVGVVAKSAQLVSKMKHGRIVWQIELFSFLAE